MSAPHEDFAAHLEDKSKMGAKPSTLRVAAVMLAHNQRHPRCYVPIHRDVPLVPNRVLLLDLDCYLVKRKAAHRTGCGRVGRMGAYCERLQAGAWWISPDRHNGGCESESEQGCSVGPAGSRAGAGSARSRGYTEC